ncbi:hypothetical protein BGX26_009780 [Mortierella sp. AD094]|nr:hypothetical protein BGX26_009780 [Mortierella sp. AD094]
MLRWRKYPGVKLNQDDQHIKDEECGTNEGNDENERLKQLLGPECLGFSEKFFEIITPITLKIILSQPDTPTTKSTEAKAEGPSAESQIRAPNGLSYLLLVIIYQVPKSHRPRDWDNALNALWSMPRGNNKVY